MSRVALGLLGGPEISTMMRLARKAEEFGFESIWSAETRFTRDAVTMVAAAALATQRVKVATGIVNPFTRGAVLTGVTFASLDELAQGRVILGIGTGAPFVLGKQGLEFDKPLTRMREYVDVCRRLIAHETVTFKGKTVQVSEVKLDFKPFRPRIPVYFGATGPKALTLASEIGDGVMFNGFITADYTGRARQQVDAGLKAAGRGKDQFDVASAVIVSIDADSRRAKDAIRPNIATYLAMFPAITKETGFPAEDIQRVQEAFAAGGAAAGAEYVADYMVDAVTASGTPDEVRAKIQERRAAGVELPVIFPATGNIDLAIEELARA